jgi:uncharacterized protein (UPF0264 family)
MESDRQPENDDAEGLAAPPPIGLLVSVRDMREWSLVRTLPIDVVDFKDPGAGPLAPTPEQLWRRAAASPSCFGMLSAALGELPAAIELARRVPGRFSFAKAGPSGVSDLATLADHWRELRKNLDRSVDLVAVAYADHELADCPRPEAIFDLAAQEGISAWLVDTFSKVPGVSVYSILGTERLIEIDRMARRNQARWVLAGSVDRVTARTVVDAGIRPRYFGVRGDVCSGNREGQIDLRRVESWIENLWQANVRTVKNPQTDPSNGLSQFPPRRPTHEDEDRARQDEY